MSNWKDYKLFLYLLLLSLSASISSAQNYIHLSALQGYPEDKIYTINSDRDGFIWIGTENGVYRFDGVGFKHFGAKEGLPNVDVWMFTVDNQNRIWCNSKHKYPFFIYGDSVHVLRNIHPGIALVSKKYYELSDDGIYVINNGFFKILADRDNYKQNSEVIRLGQRDLYRRAKISTENKQVFSDAKGYLYLARWSGDTFRFSSKPFDKVDYHTFKFWLLFNRYFFYRFNSNNEFHFYDLKNEEFKTVQIPKLNQHTARNKFVKFQDSLLSLSVSGDLYIINEDLHIKNHIKAPEHLVVYTAHMDKNYNLWYLHDNGIDLINQASQNCRYFFENKIIKELYPLDADKILVASDWDGLYSLNPYTKKKEEVFINPNITFRKFKLLGNRIILLSDMRRFIWSITNKDLEIFKPPYSAGKDAVSINKKFYEIGPQSLYPLSKNYIGPLAVKTDRTFECGIDYKGEILIGGNPGITVYDINKKQFKPLFDSFQQHVMQMKLFQDKVLLATKSNGIYVLDGNKMNQIKSTKNIGINEIDIKPDCIWAATNKGVLRIKPDDKNLSNSKVLNQFTKHDGLLTDNTNTILVLGDTLWAGSQKGLTALPWKTNMQLFNHPIQIQNGKKEIHVSPSQRKKAEIEYSVLNTSMNDKLKVEYKIAGYDDQWLPLNTNTIKLPNLNPGKYELSIRASDLHGNNSLAHSQLNIIPIWYERDVFQILLYLLALASLIWFVYYITNYFKNRKLKEVQFEKELSDVKLFALRSQMNPHFINNSLNAIQYLITNDQHEEADTYVIKFSQLVRLYFRNSQKQSNSLSEELETISHYLELEKLRFSEKLDYEINTDNVENMETEIPSMILQPIVENAIKHGIFYKKGKGKVLVNIENSGDQTNIQVIDDGVGLKESALKKSKRPGSINSTSVIKERINLLNQSNYFEIKFTREEIREEDQVKGTLVELLIKKLN